jgi:hypothetical protein
VVSGQLTCRSEECASRHRHIGVLLEAFRVIGIIRPAFDHAGVNQRGVGDQAASVGEKLANLRHVAARGPVGWIRPGTDLVHWRAGRRVLIAPDIEPRSRCAVCSVPPMALSG